MRYSLRSLILLMVVGGPLSAWGWQRWESWRASQSKHDSLVAHIVSRSGEYSEYVPLDFPDPAPVPPPLIEYPDQEQPSTGVSTAIEWPEDTQPSVAVERSPTGFTPTLDFCHGYEDSSYFEKDAEVPTLDFQFKGSGFGATEE